MIETFIALLFAHIMADFVTQTKWMVWNKRSAFVFLLHGVHVLGFSLLAVGWAWSWPIAVLVVAHLAIDRAKLAFGDGVKPFLGDQALHVLTILAVSVISPTLWADGIWPRLFPPDALAWILSGWVFIGGAVVTIRVGGFFVGKLLSPMARTDFQDASLPNAGAMIGALERAIVFGLILANQITGIAFLIAAKSILRFDAASKDRKLAEYVLIGTLASVGWAMAAGFATRHLLQLIAG